MTAKLDIYNRLNAMDNKSLHVWFYFLIIMSPSVRAGKVSRHNFSRALARQTNLIIMKCVTDVTYRPIMFLFANMQAADLVSDLHFSSL